MITRIVLEQLPRAACFFTFASLVVSVSPAYSQSYLDRLEQLVKQLEQDETPKSSEELPAPAMTPAPVPDPAKVLPSPQGGEGRVYLGLEAEGFSQGQQGVMVTAVVRNSPAWKGNIQVGDQIFAVDGYAIANLDALGERLSSKRPGDTCAFSITRDRKTMDRTVVLMDAALADEIRKNPPLPDSGPAWLGVNTNDLTQFFRMQFGLKIFAGAAVTTVAADSPAKKAGIRPGDCIVEFQTTPIQSAQDLKRQLEKSRPGEAVELTVYRGVIRKNIRLTLQKAVLPQVNGMGAPVQASGLPRPAATPTDRLAPALPSPRLPTAADLQTPALTGPQTGITAPMDSSKATRVAQLEAEVAQLRRELSDARQQLDATKDQLKSILQSLQQELPDSE